MLPRKPQVSVCIPTFNRAEMLRQSIESVLGQSFRNFELIISDNASNDGTEQVVRSFDDDRVVHARNPQNLGIRKNWNCCLTLSRGEFIAILPDDDLMMPGNIAEKAAVLASDDRLGLVHSKYDVIDGEGRVVQHNTNWGHGPDRGADALEGPENTLIPMYNTINTSTVVFRRACYQKLGGFTARAGFAFDYEYWMRIAVYNEVAFLAKPLIKWRRHEGTATTVHLGTDEAQKLGQVVAAKRSLLRKHAHAIPADVRKRMRRQMRSTLLTSVEAMMEINGTNPRARFLLAEICRTYPGLLFDREVGKTWLKSFLTRQNIDRLKRISCVFKMDSR